MTYINLTHLLVTSKMSIDTMVKLIVKMHSLTGLEIYNLVPGPNIAIASSDNKCKPYDTKLRTLSLYFNESEFSAPTKLIVLQHLLLRMPLLERVITPNVLISPLYDFVSKNLMKHPHLDKINFRFC
ncbi:hypothetical protein IWW36_003774 [Coemansia brasiliensis]|uniref:Uncharacterized protein n=1 Tax=Coemansia brasiliensis TaxID=2650707 RepID=A0A9W8I4T7_9FUNG|nr:hypothetical protein IWW36_003774 [Coemansia brasiliensis]